VTLRTGHGAGAGVPRVEVLPVDELPVGVAALSQPRDSDKARRLRSEIASARAAMALCQRPGGKVDQDGGRTLGRIGGLMRALRHEEAILAAQGAATLAELAAELLPGLDVTDPDFAKGLPKALEFITIEMAELAMLVGGGACPNGPSSMVVSSALQLLASRVMFARGDFRTASALANDSRQNIAAAHEYAAKLAVSRAAATAPSRWLRPKPPEAKP
jgi:hypothetical protein